MYRFLIHLVNPILTLINGPAQVKHKENLPDGNYILVAPHRTWMDPVLLAIAAYPKEFSFMAKEELFDTRFNNWFLRKLHAFPVNRKHPGMSAIKKPVKLLKDSDLSTIIFPTGSRYSNQLKGGALLIAKLANVPLVPAVYQGPLSFGQLWSRKKRRIAFGQPIELDRHQRLTDDYQHQVEQQLQQAFDDLDHELDPSFKYVMPPKPKNDNF
ncbi:1-acyl-sn-glycerol-3-phosphate acyltransferase [uncultured Limosilactobacillus sp.]|uniref:lysophospholipid acyltransferase family protein n=1 Tax=uncultured Limosilactobacillus sp. TaxID=2837629 RepID=UPI0025D05552|nr:1-acyl-sn-glycerol-3-phosphate acyltransferase [uncultured Limosilactobacillus sp.]